MQQQPLNHHLAQLVNFYPKTSDQTAVRKALEYCQARLQNSGGFEAVKLHKKDGFYSLTASTKNTKRPKLLLQGHIDVVDCCGELPAFGIEGDTITGRGVYDMLFGIACYLTFVEAHAAELPELDLGLMITGDEEIGGAHGTGYLVEQGYGCEVCFLPDAGHDFGGLSVAAKGVYNFDLVVHGKAHHGSRPWEGDGAANKLICLLKQLLDAFDDSDPYNSTLTITGLDCGGPTNQGPNRAAAHLDIRYKDRADFERLEALIIRLCQESDAEIQDVMFADNIVVDPDNSYIREFLKLYEQHAGRPITLGKAHGGSDARYFTSRGIPVIMLRPDGSGAHSDRETLSLSSLQKFYALMEDYILITAKAT